VYVGNVSIDRLVCRICLHLTIVLSVRDVPICQMQSLALPSRRTSQTTRDESSFAAKGVCIPGRDIVLFCLWGGSVDGGRVQAVQNSWRRK